mmetsp:Transcript_53974/g.139474  ORF Transcript_53974/g.139474 Transcript_53974/m.139474 type:complete len:269 (+) Transcript_53974:832-1638(+)
MEPPPIVPTGVKGKEQALGPSKSRRRRFSCISAAIFAATALASASARAFATASLTAGMASLNRRNHSSVHLSNRSGFGGTKGTVEGPTIAVVRFATAFPSRLPTQPPLGPPPPPPVDVEGAAGVRCCSRRTQDGCVAAAMKPAPMSAGPAAAIPAPKDRGGTIAEPAPEPPSEATSFPAGREPRLAMSVRTHAASSRSGWCTSSAADPAATARLPRASEFAAMATLSSLAMSPPSIRIWHELAWASDVEETGASEETTCVPTPMKLCN